MEFIRNFNVSEENMSEEKDPESTTVETKPEEEKPINGISTKPLSPEELAAAVEARAKALLPPKPDITVTQEFVKECLDANERGDGVLFATLNAGLFIVNVTPKDRGEWYIWNGNVWVIDDTRRSFASVEEVALEYKAQVEIL